MLSENPDVSPESASNDAPRPKAPWPKCPLCGRSIAYRSLLPREKPASPSFRPVNPTSWTNHKCNEADAREAEAWAALRLRVKNLADPEKRTEYEKHGRLLEARRNRAWERHAQFETERRQLIAEYAQGRAAAVRGAQSRADAHHAHLAEQMTPAHSSFIESSREWLQDPPQPIPEDDNNNADREDGNVAKRQQLVA